jgi:hypothetical protein
VTVYKALTEVPPDQRPDLISVLEPGLIAGSRAALPSNEEQDYPGGLVLLRDAGGAVIEQEPQGPDMMGEYNGRLYPLVSYGERHVMVDPARNLLLFAEALVRLLAAQQDRRLPVVSHYLDQRAREVSPFI